ncbi:MAG: hypothetical protein QW230_01155 [Thermofilum sp.]
MTPGYLEAGELRSALTVFLSELVETASKAGLRATPGGVVSGMGFDYAVPYLIVQGLYARGMLRRRNGFFELTESGREFVRISVEIAAMTIGASEFPEADSGRLLGAVVYALFDWSNTRRTASEHLEYAKRVRDELVKLREEPELFKLAAVLLPRMYYESGYTPLKLIESIRRVLGNKA